jgi:hypothetical protein
MVRILLPGQPGYVIIGGNTILAANDIIIWRGIPIPNNQALLIRVDIIDIDDKLLLMQ